MIAHDASNTIILADDAELLVHDGQTDGPRWRRMLGAPIVALGSGGGAVIALGRDGRATWFDPEQGDERASVEAGEEAIAGFVTPEGHVLAATRSGAVRLTPQGRGATLAFPAACAVAAGPGGRVCVGDAAGAVAEFDAAGGELCRVQLAGPPVGIAWNPCGFWVLASGRRVMRLQDGGLHHLTQGPEEMPLRGVACGPDGSVAIALGEALVLVLSWPARDTIGQLRYLDRKVVGLSFGPAPFLAVALDGGDGNKLDLSNGDLYRTDTHPGRPHRRWMVQVSVHPPEEKVAAPAAAPAPAKPSVPARAAFAPPEVHPPRGSAGVGTVMIVLGGVLAVIALIATIAL